LRCQVLAMASCVEASKKANAAVRRSSVETDIVVSALVRLIPGFVASRFRADTRVRLPSILSPRSPGRTVSIGNIPNAWAIVLSVVVKISWHCMQRAKRAHNAERTKLVSGARVRKEVCPVRENHAPKDRAPRAYDAKKERARRVNSRERRVRPTPNVLAGAFAVMVEKKALAE
jgi:hypothetical protein